MALKEKVALEVKEIESPHQPFDIYYYYKDEPYSFILDSGMDPEKLGRFSFVGARPFAVFSSKGDKINIWHREKGSWEEKDNPFNSLKNFLNTFQMITSPPSQAPPFNGGAVGYFGYDLGEEIEELPGNSLDDLKLPDCYLAFYEKIYAHDHLLNKTYLCALGLSNGENKAKELARKNMEEFYQEIKAIQLDNPQEKYLNFEKNTELKVKSNFNKDSYCRIVEKAKDYIKAGDIYQVNLSQRFEAPLDIPPLELYIRLRNINPAPFASYLNFKELVVASASPERFMRLSDKKVETRPIKGTRPRSSDPVRDNELKEELLNSEKDRAELVMIIDLERNDLGRVCLPGTVKVPELITLEAYATVFHLVSTVEGVLPSEKGVVDLLEASFPGGSITGAPKIRAMEIIDELEGLKRSIYTGSIGYITLNGDADLNIVIRTFIIKNDRAYFQVGGGIVADSEPEKEYQETLDKAKALMKSLGL